MTLRGSTLRVMGIDPGLTRCGVGIVDVAPNRIATLVYVGVIRTPKELDLEHRLLTIGSGIAALLEEHDPNAVAIERVFAQHNLRTVMGTAQASGVALHAAAARGLSVGLHTPSEVKAAITGYGSADKRQVGAMVARVLRLDAVPQPGGCRRRPRDRDHPRLARGSRGGDARPPGDASAGRVAQRREGGAGR